MTLQLKMLAFLGVLLAVFILFVDIVSRQAVGSILARQQRQKNELAGRHFLNELKLGVENIKASAQLASLAETGTAANDLAAIRNDHNFDEIRMLKPTDPARSWSRREGVIRQGGRLHLAAVTQIGRTPPNSCLVLRRVDLSKHFPGATIRVSSRPDSAAPETLDIDISALSCDGASHLSIAMPPSNHKKLHEFTRILRFILGAAIVGAVLIMLVFHFWTLAPLARLHSCLKDFRPGKSLELPQTEKSNEIGLVTRDIGSLLERIGELSNHLRESEDAYHALAAAHTSLTCRIDPQGQICEVNDAFRDYYHRSGEDLIGVPFVELLTPGSRTEMEDLLSAEAIHEAGEFECRAVDDDGNLCWQRWLWHASLDDERKIIHYHGVGSDVTREREIEHKLLRQHELVQLLLNASTDLINRSADAVDDGIAYVLQAIGEFLEVDMASSFLLSENSSDLHHTHLWRGDPDKVLDYQEGVITIDSFAWLANELAAKDVVHVHRVDELGDQATPERDWLKLRSIKSCIVTPIRINEQVAGVLLFESRSVERHWPSEVDAILSVVSEMITNALERKQSLETLQEGQQRLTSILSAVQTGIFLIRLKGRQIIDVNEQACQMVGLKRDELVGSLCMRVFESLPPMPGSPREGLSWNNEDRIRTQDGGHLPVLRTTVTIMMNDELHLVESIADLSNQKRLEKERLQTERLEGVLEMAGAACHELNQPLQVITGYTELIMMKMPKDDPNYTKLEMLRDQALKIADITKKINNITTYETQDYLNGKIIDIDKSGPQEGNLLFGLPPDKVNKLLAEVMTRSRDSENLLVEEDRDPDEAKSTE